MNLHEIAKNVIDSKGGVAKSSDFVAAGMRAADVVNMCNAGFLGRVRHGYYQLAAQSFVSEEQLLATLIPQGVVCVESALFHYGYSDFTPPEFATCPTKLNKKFPYFARFSLLFLLFYDIIST